MHADGIRYSPHCLQAWDNGLEHFLSSNPPEDVLPDVADILYDSSEGGEIIVRSMNGTAPSPHGAALGMCGADAALLVFHRLHLSECDFDLVELPAGIPAPSSSRRCAILIRSPTSAWPGLLAMPLQACIPSHPSPGVHVLCNEVCLRLLSQCTVTIGVTRILTGAVLHACGSLTDPPPFDREIIHMNVSVRGTIPGEGLHHVSNMQERSNRNMLKVC